ncbi:hypothetical protein JOC37_002098 [Desulfohalotomaculum tongense]|uniref:hypothetical protein n=1 Tax=Desulforadius tongensis TaxID=1216062 RepID=UPI0019567BEB|nr:hypothetical protein [Desulforadius tongensis]MBM7855684.1 hypothetical protein [Desulforadius tongensis]
MQDYLYPSFALDNENFEKALPIATNLSKQLNLTCRYWKTGECFVIAFKDEAVNRGFYYTHQNEKKLVSSFEKKVHFRLIYSKEDSFAQGKDLV